MLPLLARFTLHGGASTYALLTSVMGAGAVLGALRNGARGAVSARVVAGAALGLGAAMAAVALAPSLPTVLLALVFVGASSVTFTSSLNAALQLAAEPALRGRVMALWSVVFLGSTPIGGPLVGWLSAAPARARACCSARAPPSRPGPGSPCASCGRPPSPPPAT